ncbi:MAG: CotH kinase family protein, partial [Christensenellaceae bacterium]
EGVYLLCDQIQTGKGRVEISESTASVDTGYLIEMNMRIAYDPDSYVRIYHENTFYEMLSPELAQGDAGPFQEFIREYLEECTAAIKEGSWEEVSALIDVDSFVDTYIVQELTGNVDVGRYSFYLYKEAGGKLFAGPLWDFDLSGGNVSFDMGDYESCPPDRMLYASVYNVWYATLFTREEFVSLVRERLVSEEVRLKEAIARLDPDRADGYFGTCKGALERNFLRWPYDEIKPESDGYEWKYENQEVASILSIEGQYRYLYDWLMRRYDYLLSQI